MPLHLRWCFVVVLLTSTSAAAKPTAPDIACSHLSDSPLCRGQTLSCRTCHAGPPTFNAFGLDVTIALADVDGGFADALPLALDAVGGDDSDGDGISNTEELALGTMPGDAFSFAPNGGVEVDFVDENGNPFFTLNTWDAAVAFRRVTVTYCGRSPSYDEMRALSALDDGAARQAVHDHLDECLASDFWLQQGLPRLADPRVKPEAAIGKDSENPLGDYEWDYRLFVHVLSDGRDARDLLLADYHVDENGDVVDGIVPRPEPVYEPATGKLWSGGGQPVPPEHRAGMLTTQWFLGNNTMFSELPRTTAAQAYRAYLGEDIALGEGIHPVVGEPRDVDHKGVDAPACAACHSTLDPLSYAFSAYNGFDVLTEERFEETFYEDLIGAYDPSRTTYQGDGVFDGVAVPTLRDWAQQAVASDAFARNLGEMFFTHIFDDDVAPSEFADFDAAVRRLRDSDFSANALVHDLVDTPAFGRP